MEVRNHMATYTLDDIRAAAERKYGSLDIDLGDGQGVELVNPLRLAKTKRDELLQLQDKLNEDGADQAALLERALILVARTEAQGKKLVRAANGDLTILVEVFTRYTEETQAGEASASDD